MIAARDCAHNSHIRAAFVFSARAHFRDWFPAADYPPRLLIEPKIFLVRDYGASRVFQRFQASSRAFLLASLASGASPARMKPCPAPS
jgi:hypothetical protein